MTTDLIAPDSVGEDGQHRIRVGRQGIHDGSGALVAHEVLFRGYEEDGAHLGAPGDPRTGRGGFDEQDLATSQVIGATFVDFGLDEIGDGRPVYVNLTRAFLLGHLPLPFRPDDVVLEVLEHIEVDDELLAGLRILRDRGFRIAADDFSSHPSRLPLIDLVDVVKLDVLELGADLAATAADVRDRNPDVVLLAEKVEDAQAMERATDAGCTLFQGYWFTRPDVLHATRLSPTQAVCLRLLRALADPGSSFGDLEDIVAADPGLVLRVLRTASSASAGTRQPMTSLRQALVMLGPPTLSAWVTLTLLGGAGKPRNREHLVGILALAIACQDLSEHLPGVDRSTAYTAGLLAGVSRVLGLPVDTVAADAHVDPELLLALSEGQSAIGALVRAGAAVENDRAADAQRWSAEAGLTLAEVSRAVLRGWSRGLRVVSTALGD